MMSEQKREHAEWEVVENIGPQSPPRANRTTMMRALLGRWWRWKIAGVVLVAGAVLALVAALAGLLFVVGATVVVVSLAAAKIRQLWRQHGGAITPR